MLEEEFKEEFQVFADNAEVMGVEPNFNIKNGDVVRQNFARANQQQVEDYLDSSIQENQYYDETDEEEDIDEDQDNSNSSDSQNYGSEYYYQEQPRNDVHQSSVASQTVTTNVSECNDDDFSDFSASDI